MLVEQTKGKHESDIMKVETPGTNFDNDLFQQAKSKKQKNQGRRNGRREGNLVRAKDLTKKREVVVFVQLMLIALISNNCRKPMRLWR